MSLRTDSNVKFCDSKNTPKLNAFFHSLSMNFSTSKWWVKKCFQLIKKHTNSKNERDFKVKKEIPSNYPQTKRKNFSISTTSLSGNFQILNTKVRVDEEILKTTNASKNECKRSDHTIQRTNAKPEAKQTDYEKLRKTFLNSNATWYKNELFLQFLQMS